MQTSNRVSTESPKAEPSARETSHGMQALLDALVYAFSNYAIVAIRFVVNFGVRLMVAPAAFGALSVAQGLHSYVASYNGLYRNAIDREVPALQGRGAQEEADAVLNASYSILLGSLILESLLFAFAGFFVEAGVLRFAFWTIAILNLLDGFAATDRITLKATMRFRALSGVQVLVGIVQAALLVGGAWLWDANGYFAGLATSAVFRFVTYRFVLGQGWFGYLSLSHPMRVVRSILKVGGAFTIFGLSGRLLLTVDRYFVVAFLSLTDLGFYSLGISLMEVLQRLTASIAGSYFPRMMRMIGNGELNRAAQSAQKLQASVVLMMAATFSVLAIVIEPLIRFVLPEYAAAIPALQVMVVGGYLYGAQAVARQLHVGLGRFRRATVITLIGAAFAIAFDFALVGSGLVGIAIATSAAVGLTSLALNVSAQRMVRARGLVLWMLVGLAMLLTVEALLVLSPAASVLAVAIFGIAAAKNLTRLLGIPWRQMPMYSKSYLAGRKT